MPERSGATLALRLRTLRENQWPDLKLTQRDLATAFDASVPLISSWESGRKPVAPPESRLRAYATFFATGRSVQGDTHRILDDTELTAEESSARDELLQELLALRGGSVTKPLRIPLARSDDTIGGGPWFFEDQRPVTIVCARLPQDLLQGMPYTDPNDPDYVRSYTYADLDSLIELHGHIRAVNPAVEVRIRPADDLADDDLSGHTVLLGGVDWNPVTRDILRRADLPVRQSERPTDDEGLFEVGEGETRQEFRPLVDEFEDPVTKKRTSTLREDIGLFYRGRNPYNKLRTITVCSGVFGRGTYGVVRALTDTRFRDRNERHLAERFAGADAYSVLARVLIVNTTTQTPDWTSAAIRLHEWPEQDA